MAKSTLTKICTKCKIEKSIDYFYKTRGGDGFNARCKQCISAYSKQQYQKIDKDLQVNQKLCECGCGQPIIVRLHHKWAGIPRCIHGHYSRIYNGMKGKKQSQEALKKMSAAHLGKPFSDERKKKISEAQKGRNHTPQNNFKKGNIVHKGMRHSEETKAKMSKSAMGRIVGEETRKKISEGNKGKVLSKEHRKKISIAEKGKVVTKEQRGKMSRAKKMSWKNPEFCKMMGRAWGQN